MEFTITTIFVHVIDRDFQIFALSGESGHDIKKSSREGPEKECMTSLRVPLCVEKIDNNFNWYLLF